MRRRGLGRTMARTAVIAGTATAVSGHVARRQDARYRQQAADQAVSSSLHRRRWMWPKSCRSSLR